MNKRTDVSQSHRSSSPDHSPTGHPDFQPHGTLLLLRSATLNPTQHSRVLVECLLPHSIMYLLISNLRNDFVYKSCLVSCVDTLRSSQVLFCSEFSWKAEPDPDPSWLFSPDAVLSFGPEVTVDVASILSYASDVNWQQQRE